MMGEGSAVTLAALAWLFLRMASEGELRQRLIEQGLDPEVVKRAVRYGRGALSSSTVAETRQRPAELTNAVVLFDPYGIRLRPFTFQASRPERGAPDGVRYQ